MFSNKHKAAMLLCLLLAISAVASKNPPPFLHGISFPGHTKLGAQVISANGGASINIVAEHLQGSAQDYKVIFVSNGTALKYEHSPSAEDSFNSGPASGTQRTYEIKMPGLQTIYGPLAHLHSEETLELQLKKGDHVFKCKVPSRCWLRYMQYVTTNVYEYYPTYVYSGQEVCIYWYTGSAGGAYHNHYRIGQENSDITFNSNAHSTKSRWSKCTLTGTLRASSSAKVDIKFTRGTNYDTAWAANYDIDKTKFQIKIVPTIDVVSATEVYKAGGAHMKITGRGFSHINSENEVMVDGEICTTFRSALDGSSVECSLPSKTTLTTGNIFAGGIGHNYNFHQGSTVTKHHNTELVSRQQRSNHYSIRTKGWFVAPKTANYTFYTSCDDSCVLRFKSTPDSIDSPVQLVNQNYAVSKENWINPAAHSKATSKVDLVAGSKYYYELDFTERKGNDHMMVGVIIDGTDPTHPMKEIDWKKLEIGAKHIYESHSLIIDSSTKTTAGTKLFFTNDEGWTDLNKYNSRESGLVSFNSTEDEFKNAIKNYYNNMRGGAGNSITVTKELVDSAGKTDAAGTRAKFTWTINTLHQKPYSTSIGTYQNSTGVETSFFETAMTAPLSGKYTIGYTRTYPNGKQQKLKTISLDLNTSPLIIQREIVRAIPELNGKIIVYYDRSTYTTHWDGISLVYGVHGMSVTLSLESSTEIKSVEEMTTHALTGGTKITISPAVTVRYGSNNLNYRSIPGAWLRTFETTPQLTVKTKGVYSACPAYNCTVKFIDNVGEITKVEAAGLTNSTIKITGTAFPLMGLRYVSVGKGLRDCNIQSQSEVEVQCEIDHPLAGTYDINLQTANGAVAHQGGTAKQLTLNPKITFFSPTTGGVNGDETLTITGDYFGMNAFEMAHTTVHIGSALCPITSISQHTIKCTTPAGLTANQIMVTSFGASTNTTTNFNIASTHSKILSITPTSLSPAIKRIISVTLNVTSSSNKADYIVILTGPTLKLECRVTSVNTTTKTLKAHFPGSKMEDYIVTVWQKGIGVITGSPNVVVKGEFKITAIDKATASAYGGTVVTLTGVGFSDILIDNQAGIIKGGETYKATIQAANSTHLVFIAPIWPGINGVYTSEFEVAAFLKASIEAKCEVVGGCVINYTDTTLPGLKVEGGQTYEASVTNDGKDYFQATLIGTNLGTTAPKVYVDGLPQTVISTTNTKVVIRIDNYKDRAGRQLQVVTENGNLPGLTKFDIPLSIYSTSPKTVSEGGQLVSIRVGGLGNVQAEDIVVYHGTSALCKSIVRVKNDQLNCFTKPGAWASSDITIKFDERPTTPANAAGTVTVECAAPGNCAVGSMTASPTVTAVTVSGNTLTIDGTGFTQTGTMMAYVGMVSASASGSATQVTATFNDGFPPGTFPVTLKWLDGNNVVTMSSIAKDLSTPWNPTVTGTTCSFSGGCDIKFAQTGIKASAASGQMNVKVCGNKADFNLAQSTADELKVTIPKLVTTKSVNVFKVETPNMIKGKEISTGGYPSNAFDGDIITRYSTRSNNCYVGYEFPTGHSATITKVRWYMSAMDRKYDYFLEKTKIQTTTDGSTFTDEHVFDYALKEGWNEVDFTAAPLSVLSGKRQIRFAADAGTGCSIEEIQVYGHVVPDNSDTDTYACDVEVTSGTVAIPAISNKVTYTSAQSAVLDSVSPRYGTHKGGTTLTLTGTGFPTVAGDLTILIDTYACAVQTASATQITCITGKRTVLQSVNTFTIMMSNSKSGYVSMQKNMFYYTNLWSDEDTWGGDFPPREGDSVQIPKGKTLLYDVDSTPVLKLVTIEGQFVILPDASPTHHRRFDAHYVFVGENARMEVGTEQHRYTSKITITMHGNYHTIELPIYGNKGIFVRKGTLDMHGIETKSWTSLDSTALAGATQITLIEPVNWNVGDEIIIAPTDFSVNHGEQRTIKSITNKGTKPVITFTKRLRFKHYASTQKYTMDGQTTSVEVRGEVGLLTRNVVYQGEETSSVSGKFGAHIMLHSQGDESLTGRFSYCEFRFVGQAFQLGRYPIHFHMIGTVHNSYIKGNSIHHTYNRGVTLHGVHYLKVIDNVIYDSMGHTIFIEDAVETKNYIKGNLVIKTKKSWSLLNTDQTPACFWITHPDNQFIDNHCAGSERYGFWFDLQKPMGPSAKTAKNVCPTKERLGEFNGNVAHGCGRYGLRIFHVHVPMKFGCRSTNGEKNVPIEAIYRNFLSYKNGRNGAITEFTGLVKFQNFTVMDNGAAGMEFHDIRASPKLNMTHDAFIKDSIVVLNSDNDGGRSGTGIIGPRCEGFIINNVKFFNFKAHNSALGTCSHCFHGGSSDSGARTYYSRNLKFDSSLTRLIKYQEPFRGIMHDLDGTLTGYTGGWAVNKFTHIRTIPECMRSAHTGNPMMAGLADDDAYYAKFGGVVCLPTVQVRRFVFYAGEKQLENKDLKIINLDTAVTQTKTSKVGVCGEVGDILKPLKNDTTKEDPIGQYDRAYRSDGKRCDPDNYQIFIFRGKMNPNKHWGFPYVAGYNYGIHWRAGAFDFNKISALTSKIGNLSEDRPTIFHFNHTDRREVVDLSKPWFSMKGVNTTQPQHQPPLANATHSINNITRHFQLVIGGPNGRTRDFGIKNYRCDPDRECGVATPEGKVEIKERLWSEPRSWKMNATHVPKVPTGGKVRIMSNWNMILDVTDPPPMEELVIEGSLTIRDGGNKNYTIRAGILWVRKGSFLIGNKTDDGKVTRFTDGRVTIILEGRKTEATMIFNKEMFEAGNKILANTGTVQFLGKELASHKTQLAAIAKKGSTMIETADKLDVKVGDTLIFYPNGRDGTQGEYGKVSDISQNSITLEQPLQHTHWGGANTAPDYNGVDMRGEVAVIDRNIVIKGTDVDGWGCQFVTADFNDIGIVGNKIVRVRRLGYTYLDHVQFHNCSQHSTERAALRFQNVLGHRNKSVVKDCAITSGNGWGILVANTSSITISNNVIFDFQNIGIKIDTSPFTKILNNFIGYFGGGGDTNVGLYACRGTTTCEGQTIQGNRISGSISSSGVAFLYPTEACNATKLIKDNTVHSSEVGAYSYGSPHACGMVTGVYAYKTRLDGVLHFSGRIELLVTGLTTVDCGVGISPFVGGGAEHGLIKVNNCTVYGDSPIPDTGSECVDTIGMFVGSGASAGKGYPLRPAQLPIHKVKSEGNLNWKTILRDITFKNFASRRRSCGSKQACITIEKGESDQVHPQMYIGTKFINVADNARFQFWKPPRSWAKISDCGQFPCTGPLNSLNKFFNTTKDGVAEADRSYISRNVGVGKAVIGCIEDRTQMVYNCNRTDLAVLVIDSLDGDSRDRSVQPVYYIGMRNWIFINKMNSYMDHGWDGFYTSQKRTSRFPGLVQENRVYNVSFTGTPPGKLHYSISLSSPNNWLTLDMYRPKGLFYYVYARSYDNDRTLGEWKRVHINDYDRNTGKAEIIRNTKCGENRWDPRTNRLEIHIKGGCEVKSEQVPIVKTIVRLDWTLDAFYNSGGHVSFAAKLASVLNIPTYRIKVVSIMEGSVIVDTVITPEDNSTQTTTEQEKELKYQNNLLTSLYKAGKLDFGAPILDFSSVMLSNNGDVTVSDVAATYVKSMHGAVIAFIVISVLTFIIGIVYGLIKMRMASKFHQITYDEANEDPESGMFQKQKSGEQLFDMRQDNMEIEPSTDRKQESSSQKKKEDDSYRVVDEESRE